MTDSKLSASGGDPREPEVLRPSSLESVIHGDTEDVYGGHGALDPTYVAKAKILNNAFSEIGMGKYQVGLLTFKFGLRALQRPDSTVASFFRCRFWLAVVRLIILRVLYHVHHPNSISTGTTYGL
jgi:hypothetical protein